MRDLAILFVHLLATIAKLMGPGGARAVVAESLLVRQQLVILNQGRERAPNLRPMDRVITGLCTLFMRPSRLLRSAVAGVPGVNPDTLMAHACSHPPNVVSACGDSPGTVISEGCFRVAIALSS